MTEFFHPHRKRSITIAGHETSITLEPIFWEALRAAAVEINLPLNALVAQIDVEWIGALDPPNLASAIRIWLYARALTLINPPQSGTASGHALAR